MTEYSLNVCLLKKFKNSMGTRTTEMCCSCLHLVPVLNHTKSRSRFPLPTVLF